MRKLFILLTLIAIVLIGGYYYLPEVRWHKAAQSAGGYPYQIGLTNVVMIKCVPSTPPPKCNGGNLCNTVDFATCSNYWEVTGASAGGTGQPPLLLSQTAIGQAGLAMGGQLIYGGTVNSMYLSPNAVLASAGGCSGCGLGKADSSIIDRIASVANYIIAGFRGK